MKAPDAATAARLVEIHKACGMYQLGNESGALRYTVFEPTDDFIVRNVAEFAHAKAHDKHKALAGPTRDFFTKPMVAAMDAAWTGGGVLEYAATAHLEKDDT